jgi:hypothetical protein
MDNFLPNKLSIAEQILISKFNYSHTDIGYFKYKSHTPTIVDCIKEYPITEFILEKIKKKELVWEFEMEEQKPKLYNGKLIVLI